MDSAVLLLLETTVPGMFVPSVNVTLSGAAPDVGDAVRLSTGGVPPPTVTCATVYTSAYAPGFTANVALYAPAFVYVCATDAGGLPPPPVCWPSPKSSVHVVMFWTVVPIVNVTFSGGLPAAGCAVRLISAWVATITFAVAVFAVFAFGSSMTESFAL